jgi:hypothetical protein
MASTFKSLYSDFQDAVKTYTEKLDVTERQFMRRLTRGMQLFQRETEYVTQAVQLTLGQNATYPNNYELPSNCIRVLEFRDVNDIPLMETSYIQHRSIVDKRNGGRYLETPRDESRRLTHLLDETGLLRNVTVLARRVILNPIFPSKDTSITIVYIPDISAYDEADAEWADWAVSDADFMNLFRTARVTPELQHYENAFLNFAIANYIQSLGHINYKVYEQKFNEEVQNAIINKVSYHRGLQVDYAFGTYA